MARFRGITLILLLAVSSFTAQAFVATAAAQDDGAAAADAQDDGATTAAAQDDGAAASEEDDRAARHDAEA
ncbi:MAG: hypothetical protein JRH11_22510, partial [Deltaproteobacteria bacterium]|nr:hypothetical protein [Deltaproteobacteria bacterium]